MDSSPLTDKSVGIPHNDWNESKFRDVRSRAKQERDDIIKHRSKRNKKEKVPKYDIDQELVIVHESWRSKDRKYNLVKIVDFVDDPGRGYKYYAVIMKTTHKSLLNRIGRLCTFSEHGHYSLFSNWEAAKVSAEGMKWIEEEQS